jgi:hypothetical protein
MTDKRKADNLYFKTVEAEMSGIPSIKIILHMLDPKIHILKVTKRTTLEFPRRVLKTNL